MVSMQTTLRIDDELYREAKAEAVRSGITVTRFIEEALRLRLASSGSERRGGGESIRERDQLMEALLQATAHFRIGPKASREEMHER